MVLCVGTEAYFLSNNLKSFLTLCLGLFFLFVLEFSVAIYATYWWNSLSANLYEIKFFTIC